MDLGEERRNAKKQKEHYDRLGFVADSQYGIPRRCSCGGRIIQEVRRNEKYDTIPGKRFFTCANYEDDGLHYRHPWLVAVEEEIQKLSKRVEEAEQVIEGVWSLSKRIEVLEEQVRSLTVDVGNLEKISYE